MNNRNSRTGVALYYVLAVLLSTFLILAAFRAAEIRHGHAAGERERVQGYQSSKVSSAKNDKHLDWTAVYGKLPLAFEENQGQASPEVRYVSHGKGYGLVLTAHDAVLRLRHPNPLHGSPLCPKAGTRDSSLTRQAEKVSVLRMYFEGANSAPKIEASDRLPGRANYFIGNDPRNWHTDIPSYGRVKYSGVYPGVDLVFYGSQSRLEYDFVVAPGADPSIIRMNLEGTNQLRTNARGDLVVGVSAGEVTLQKPVVYQLLNGVRHEIAGEYLLAGRNGVRFAVANYDRSEPLVLDPVLNYSSYLGGSSDESGLGIAVDSQGDAFVTGTTFSTDFPTTTNAFNKGPLAVNAKGAVFVTELNPAGTQQIYSTYLAGSGGDSGLGIALDPSGKIYVTGQTFSIDFPTTSSTALKPGPLAANVAGTSFVSKIDPALSGASSLVYSSYLGGPNGDFGSAITADGSGNAYVTGFTKSIAGPGPTAFPTTSGAFQSSLSNAFGNAFVSRIDTTKSGNASLVYSTYLGGNGANAANPASVGFGDAGFGVAVDSTSAAYIVGITTSTNFPTTATAAQPAAPMAATIGTVFVSKIDTSGGKTGTASLLYSTYLGGENLDFGFGIALGPSNVAYVTGTTSSLNFPTFPGAYQRTGNASGAAFISVIDTGLTGSASLKYSTFLGGAGSSTAFGIRADAAGNAYVAGQTNSPSFPVTSGAFQTTLATGAPADAFISVLNPGGKGAADLIYSSYFGGKGSTSTDSANAIAIDAAANAYIAGTTYSTNLPVFPNPGAFQTILKGPSDAFVAKLTLVPVVGLAPANLAFGGQILTTTSAARTVTLTNNGNAALAIASVAITGDFAQTNNCGTSVVAGAMCTISVTFTPTVLGARAGTLTVTHSANGSPQTVLLTGSGWDFSVTAPATLNVTQGATGTATVTVTPRGGLNTAVGLACSGAPALSACTISPSSVTPSDGVTPVTATLSLSTTALGPPQSIPGSPIWMLGVVSLCLAAVLLLRLSFLRAFRIRLAMAAAMILFVVLAGCSGPKHPATPKGTSNLTITAMSGSVSHTTTLALTVN